MLDRTAICFILAVTIVGFTVRNAVAIKCWVCDGKSTLKECHNQHGAMLECPNPDDVCQNDFRTASGRQLITKGCKQRAACRNEVRQNKNNQCGRKIRNMVCRCCCATSGCNSKESGCKPPPPPCEKLPAPINGFTNCPREIKFGSRCSIRCFDGYRRIGSDRATCARKSKGSRSGVWKIRNKPVTCKKVIIRCNPERTAPKNGFVSCENVKEYEAYEGLNYAGSKCTYGCERNFYLKGKNIATCTRSRLWDSEEPTCVKGKCTSPQNDPNRITKCTTGNTFGSKCTFSCKDGFQLIGETESTCSQTRRSSSGYWTNKFPICSKILCFPELTDVTNGKVQCSRGNMQGSVCTFTCDTGYDLDGTANRRVSATCQDDGDGDALGVWNRPPATCSRIICEPSFRHPFGGQVTCSDVNFHGSECAFSCNSDYDLVGTTKDTWVSTCESGGNGDTNGKWSEVAVDCKPIVCVPEYVQERTERISCTKKNGKDSVCTLSCHPDFVLEGTATRFLTSECLPPKDGTAVGTWSRVEKPNCIPITCERFPVLRNGFRICSLLNLRGSFCVFYCADGHDRIGSSYTMCRKGKVEGSPIGEWTADQPVCRLGQCDAPKYDKDTVVQTCTPPDGFKASEYRVGTQCTYTCKSDAYYMVPNTESEVLVSRQVTAECNNEKQWTALVPRCLLKTCLPQLTAPDMGYSPKCTRGNEFGSTCSFSCSEKHEPSHDRPLVCLHDEDNEQFGKWSEGAPLCERSHCDDFGPVMNGRLDCSNGTRIGSVCQLICINRYTTKRYEDTKCMTTATWSRRDHFCCVPCLFNSRIKIAMAFDRSAIKNRRNWQMMIDFTESYLTLMLQYRLQVSFAGFTYASDVDVGEEISTTRLRSVKDVAPIVDKLRRMEFGGKVSSTGKALQYINNVIYEEMDSKREHFIILVSSGRSNDKVLDISKKIRNRGISILATGINVGRLGKQQLLQIAGSQRNVFATNSLDDVRQVPQKIFQISKSTGCTSISKSQSCP